MGNKRYNNNSGYDDDYLDMDFDHRKYAQSALFDVDDDVNDEYYSYSYDKNSYITEGNEYFNDNRDYFDSEYSYDDNGYNGYYYDDVYDDIYDEEFYNNYEQTQKYDDGYGNTDDRKYIEGVYKEDIYNTASMNSEKVSSIIDEGQLKNGISTYNRSVNYAIDYDLDTDDTHNKGRNSLALKYNNIPTNNIQFEESFVVSGNMFEDDEEKIISMKDIINLAVCVVMAFVLAYLIAVYGVQHTEVEGVSMDFNLKDKDVLLIDKFSYRFGKPKRFDIVEFPYKNTNYIKRIIGLPGETVRVAKDGKVFINDNELKEDTYSYTKSSTNGCEDIKLGENEYFVLGDNRNRSDDSRGELGAVKGEDFTGKAIFRIYPFNEFGSIDDSVNKKIKEGNTDLAKDGGYVPDDIEKLDGQVTGDEVKKEN